MPSDLTPRLLEPLDSTTLKLGWSDQSQYAVPYLDLRYLCPCAGCVDEHTGKRIIQRTSVSPQIRPIQVQMVGRYAVQFFWSDGHSSGMYHYETLRKICEESGKMLS